MAVSEVEICNNALLLIGDQSITSFEEANQRAFLCKIFYPATRNEILTEHPWNFSIVRSGSLARLGDDPAFGFTARYQLPVVPKVLRVIDVFRPGDPAPGKISTTRILDWRVEGDAILTNESTQQILFIAEITDPNKFSSSFREVLEQKLAFKLSYPLTKKLPLQKMWDDTWKLTLRRNKSADGQESSGSVVESNELLDVR